MNFPKRTGNQRRRDAVPTGVFKKVRRENCVDSNADKPTFPRPSNARVAELADAVDSKSTDESLVGSTPTPGTSGKIEFSL
jgi:hypothetical protein